jgi:hypothetical protein
MEGNGGEADLPSSDDKPHLSADNNVIETLHGDQMQ